jgi:hypothetical protein
MIGRPTIVLGILLIAGSYAVTNDLGIDDSPLVPVADFDPAELGARDSSTWPNGAVTVQPEEIFQN